MFTTKNMQERYYHATLNSLNGSFFLKRKPKWEKTKVMLAYLGVFVLMVLVLIVGN